MNIAICDDDQLLCNTLKFNVDTYFQNKSLEVDIDIFLNAESLLNQSKQYDIILLDIKLQNINGIEASIAIKELYPNTLIILITAYNEYIDDAFKINAFRFLSKPINIFRLYRALDDATECLKSNTIKFYDTKTCSNIKINSKDIIYVEIAGKKTKIVSSNGVFYSNEKISFWKECVKSCSFICPHASFFVNLEYSIMHTRKTLTLAKKNKDGSIAEEYSIPIAPKKQAEVKMLFFNCIERR